MPATAKPQLLAFGSDVELRAFSVRRAAYRRLHPRSEPK